MKKHINSTVDTQLGNTWQEFIEIVERYGFKCGFRQNFTGNARQGGVEEEEIIFFHEEKGLILYAESYNHTSVNNATVYGEVKTMGKLDDKQLQVLSRPHVNEENNTCCFCVEVVSGLYFHLDAISKVCEFSKTWHSKQSLWLLNYMELMNRFSNYKEIMQQKINSCSPEVRKIIFE